MDSSYSNLGEFNSSAGGDIILVPSPSTTGGKKKKIIIIAVAVAASLLIGLFVWLIASGVFEDEETKMARYEAEFHDFLDEKSDDILALVGYVDYYYSGLASKGNFVISEDDYEVAMSEMSDGISALESVFERLKNGPRLTGTVIETDVGGNYDGLLSVISNSIDRYRVFVDFTGKMMRVGLGYVNQRVSEILDGYSQNAISCGQSIADLASASAAIREGINRNNCMSYESSACLELLNNYSAYSNELRSADPRIPVIYAENVGEFGELPDGYIHVLLAATRGDDER